MAVEISFHALSQKYGGEYIPGPCLGGDTIGATSTSQQSDAAPAGTSICTLVTDVAIRYAVGEDPTASGGAGANGAYVAAEERFSFLVSPGDKVAVRTPA